jgi:ribosomal protein L21
MKYAIVEASGKQYRAEEGKTLRWTFTANIGDAVTSNQFAGCRR